MSKVARQARYLCYPERNRGIQTRKNIGLTGPVGAGKDSVAKILKRRGAYIIDVDAVAHELYTFQSPVWHELVKTFGSKILVRGGKINRKKLGEIVFSDKAKLEELNRIVHPWLAKEVKNRVVQAFRPANNKMIVINAALPQLFAGVVDEVWVVMASKEKRLKRLIKAGRSKADALKRINSQVSQKEYLEIADVIIKNEGTLKQLNAKVRACLQI